MTRFLEKTSFSATILIVNVKVSVEIRIVSVILHVKAHVVDACGRYMSWVPALNTSNWAPKMGNIKQTQVMGTSTVCLRKVLAWHVGCYVTKHMSG